MSKNNKPKKNDVDKLRKILDNNSKNKLSTSDEKYLATLKERLKDKPENIRVSSKVVEKKEDSMEPKVTIHPRKAEKIVEFQEIEEETTTEDVKTEESRVIDDDIFDVEKVEIKKPHFIEVKPKEEKDDDIDEFNGKTTLSEGELSEWEPVEGDKEEEIPSFSEVEPEKEAKQEYQEQVEIEKIEVESKKDIVSEKEVEKIFICPSCGHELTEKINFCPNCGNKLSSDEELKPAFIPVKPSETEKKDIIWEEEKEEIEEEKPDEVEQTPEEEIILEEIVDDDIKINVFKDLESIDDETAVLLYDNGFTSLDALAIASVKDIRRVKGIKRGTAKKIKKEIDEKSEWDLEEKEDEKIVIGETAEIDLTEEEIDEKELEAEIEAKIQVFKDLESVDDKTAVLLYDCGYTKLDLLEESGYNQLKKIKGLKRKTAKKIIQEMDQIREEKLKIQPIEIGETSKGEVTEDQIKEEKPVEEEAKGPTPVELKTKSEEWKPVEETKEEKPKEKLQWEPVEEAKKEEDEEKTQAEINLKKDVFKDLESVDEKTALLLYDNGYTNIDLIKEADLKQLKKIKGIKKKRAKEIINEIEDKFKEPEVTEPLDEKDEGEYFEEDEEVKEEAEEIDDKIANYVESPDTDEEFFEEEIREDIPPIKKEKNETFKEIDSIDEKISNLLKENDIKSIEDLKNATIKDLTRIRGIKRKKAKQIKKEVNELVTSESEEELTEENNPYIKEEETDDEWESFDEDKISEKKLKELNGFRHGDYTLYEKKIKTKSGSTRTIRFFSKAEIEEAEPIQMPKGYEIKENKKTHVPYLKKKKKK
jgi:rubrerythrin